MTPSDSQVHVVHVAEAFGGGLLEVVRDICAGHVEAGMKVSVIHGRRPETPSQTSAHEMPRGVSTVEIPGWGRRVPHREIASIARLKRKIAEIEADIVILHSSFAGVAGALGRLDVPTVYVPHAFASQIPGSRITRKVHARGERFAIARSDLTAAVSHSEATTAKGFGARRVVAIPNGIAALDSPRWPDTPNPPQQPRVAGIGRLVPQRQPKAAARILSSVSDLAEVVWVGGGGSGTYAAEAAQYLADRSIDLTGWVQPAAVCETLRSSTIYLHWTTWDGLPITVLEAMANDALVIASDTAPNREVVGPDRVFQEEAAAVAAIRDILENPVKWRSAIEDQRKLASKYGAKRMQTEWNALVMEMVTPD